jgi:hypothetical protein
MLYALIKNPWWIGNLQGLVYGLLVNLVGQKITFDKLT